MRGSGAGGGADRVPPFVALTGGIGAGKSTALAALARLGAATLSADAVVHELYGERDVRDAVRARFGETVAPGGVIDRRRLASLAFASDTEREWLERLIWPRVRERVARWRERHERARPQPRALVVEVPLLFEAGQESAYDATIAITAAESLRRTRAAARGHQALDERDARQLAQAQKAARATFALTNDGSVAELEQRLAAVLDTLGC